MPVGLSSRLTRLRHVVALAHCLLWQLCLTAIKMETRREYCIVFLFIWQRRKRLLFRRQAIPKHYSLLLFLNRRDEMHLCERDERPIV